MCSLNFNIWLLWKPVVKAKHAELRDLPSESLDEGFGEMHASKGFIGVVMKCV